MRRGQPRSSLERLPPSSSNDADMRERALHLWRLFGIIVIWPDQKLTWAERGYLEAMAEKIYGRRR